MQKNILIIASFLITNIFANTDYQRIQFERIKEVVFKKFHQNIIETKQAYRDSANSFLMDVITGATSSAPMNGFVMNIDLPDTIVASEVEITTFVSVDNQNTWNSFDGYPINGPAEHTWESIANFTGLDLVFLDSYNTIDWYATGTVDASMLFGDPSWIQDPLQRLFFTQTPYYSPLDGDEFPIPENFLATLAYDYTQSGTVLDAYDIKGLYGAHGDNRLYYKIEYGDECCEFGDLFGPWYFYLIGVTNPVSPYGDSYGFFHCYALSGLYHIGMIKLHGDDSEIEYLDGIDYNFAYNGNALEVYFAIDDLIADDGFGPWPNQSNALITLTNTFGGVLDFENLEDSVIEEYDIMRSTILMNSQSQQDNTVPNLSNPSIDFNSNTINVEYQDDDNNLPIHKYVKVCESDYSCDCGIVDGDLNSDYITNILDIVGIVSIVINNPTLTDSQLCSIDTDFNGVIDILDVVKIVNVIIVNESAIIEDSSVFNQMESQSNQYSSGVQFQFDYDFSNLTSGEYRIIYLFSDYSEEHLVKEQLFFNIPE